MDKHECAPENAELMLTWIRTRGGVAVWRSANLSNPGASWSTPAMTSGIVGAGGGEPMRKPTWEADDKPERIITDPGDIEVVTRREVKRFHVAVRAGSQGLMLKVSDGGTRRIRSEVAKAGDGASYYFDYGDEKNAVITVPDKRVPLLQYVRETEGSKAS
jgi:hypothetical protein